MVFFEGPTVQLVGKHSQQNRDTAIKIYGTIPLNRTETQQSATMVWYSNISFPSKYQIALVIGRVYSLYIIKSASQTIITSNVTSKVYLSFFFRKALEHQHGAVQTSTSHTSR